MIASVLICLFFIRLPHLSILPVKVMLLVSLGIPVCDHIGIKLCLNLDFFLDIDLFKVRVGKISDQWLIDDDGYED